jgi:hypothetical protein
MAQPPSSVGGNIEIPLHLHLDGVRTACHATGIFDSDGVMLTTILLYRDIGLSSFFRPKEGEFSAVHIAGRIHAEAQRFVFANEHDWRELDLPQRVQECVGEHVDALIAFLKEMGVDATCEVDPETVVRFQQAVLSRW